MKCPECQSQDVRRSARRGLFDNLLASTGRWPFCCGQCGNEFRAMRRYAPTETPKPAELRESRSAGSPDLAFRLHDIRPTAQVVIQADDHVQLDRILLAVRSAVSSYQSADTHETAGRR